VSEIHNVLHPSDDTVTEDKEEVAGVERGKQSTTKIQRQRYTRLFLTAFPPKAVLSTNTD